MSLIFLFYDGGRETRAGTRRLRHCVCVTLAGLGNH
jgi:hypothetical protein